LEQGVEVSNARTHPVGDVLKHMSLAKQVYKRASVSSLEELIGKWEKWHVDYMEPIVNYSMSCRFGRNLYANQLEKKLVGWFITNARVRGGNSIVKNGDTVVIPEGSSAFYVGMAIAACEKRASIITSNGALYCEYLDNPALASSFRNFYVIGGLADLDRDRHLPDSGGVFGMESHAAYTHAIKDNPMATVVIMPTSGILPEDGPFALVGESRALKLSIIRDALEAQVRELVLVADYTKHLEPRTHSYGAQIMPRTSWQALHHEYRGRISLVTAPPPNIRSALRQANLADSANRHPAARKSLDALGTQAWGDVDREYNRNAVRFGATFHDDRTRLMFHEAYDTDDTLAHELDQVLQRA
jgi:hypothetical protein